LRLLVFVLYPFVPNTIHVRQEMDKIYGPFMTQLLSNLDLMGDARSEAKAKAKKSLSLQPKFVGLPLFGGVDHETKCNVELGAFQKAFAPLKYLAAYERSAPQHVRESQVPVQLPAGHRCLDQGTHNSEDVAELYNIGLFRMQTNELAICDLTQAGNDVQLLKATLTKPDKAERQITHPNTRAWDRRPWHGRGHGGRFHVTDGMHVTSDDLFIWIEMAVRKEERVALEKEKKLCRRLQSSSE
jgi:hypothetical protein